MSATGSSNQSKGFLNTIERIGNAMPDITMLFMYALVVCWVLSFGLSFIEFNYIHPVTKEKIRIINMFQPKEIVDFILLMVKNFISFPPLGITIVATLGIGIAEASGFVQVAIKKLLSITPKSALTPVVVIVSIISHMASDSAYVILMPVAALMFHASGRHPLAGIAAAFAGLAGGFTASFTPSIIDPVMQSFTEKAARIMDPGYNVSVLCNYFVSLGGTIGVVAAVWFVTERIVEPRLRRSMPVDGTMKDSAAVALQQITPEENRAFRIAGLTLLLMMGVVFAMLVPADSILRAPDGSLTSPKAPIMQAIVPLIFLFFAIPGLIHGFMVRKYHSSRDVTAAMERVTQSLVSFIVFSFFGAQFLYSFGHSNLGTLLALSGADLLRSLAMPSGFTVLGVIILTGFLNLIITSATSKWAILAPVLVPMLMAVGISPELTQAAFRVSDSAVNVCTPMFAFYPLILTYCKHYCPKAGVGTLSSMMLPYTFALLIVLTATLYLFWGLNIPIGFDSSFTWAPPAPQ